MIMLENNRHYSEQTGHKLRGLFAKRERIMEREAHLRRNEEWHALSGRENRYPGQFGEPDAAVTFVYRVGDNGFAHTSEQGEALIVPGVNCGEEEETQLRERGAVFPIETAQPAPSIKFERDPHI